MEHNEHKGKQTPGAWIVISKEVVNAENTITVASCSGWGLEQEKANLALIAEAGTVCNESGLWPREMQERIKKLEEALGALLGEFGKVDHMTDYSVGARAQALLTTPSTIN